MSSTNGSLRMVPSTDTQTPPGGKSRRGRKVSKSAPLPTPTSGLSVQRRAAIATGSVAVGLLVLSVSHLTEAITSLTGSPWFLSMLLAIGIDAGMLCAEAALLLSNDSEVKHWAGAVS